MQKNSIAPLITAAAIANISLAYAQSASFKKATDETAIAEVTSLSGKVSVLRNGNLYPLSKRSKLYLSDQVVSSNNSATHITFADGSNTVVLPNSSLDIQEFFVSKSKNENVIESTYNLIRGKAKFFFNPKVGKRNGRVKTSNMVLGVRGTSLLVSEDKATKASQVVVFSGKVEASPASNIAAAPVIVKAGETTKVVGSTNVAETPRQASKAELAKAQAEVATLPLEKVADGSVPTSVTMPAPIEKPVEKSTVAEVPPNKETTPPPVQAPTPPQTQKAPTEVQKTTPSKTKPPMWEPGLFGRIGLGGMFVSNSDKSSVFNVAAFAPVLHANLLGYRSSSNWSVSLFLNAGRIDTIQRTETYERSIASAGIRFDYNFWRTANLQTKRQWFVGIAPSRAAIELQNEQGNTLASKSGVAIYAQGGFESFFNNYFGYSVGIGGNVGNLTETQIDINIDPATDTHKAPTTLFMLGAFVSITWNFDF